MTNDIRELSLNELDGVIAASLTQLGIFVIFGAFVVKQILARKSRSGPSN